MTVEIKTGKNCTVTGYGAVALHISGVHIPIPGDNRAFFNFQMSNLAVGTVQMHGMRTGSDQSNRMGIAGQKWLTTAGNFL